LRLLCQGKTNKEIGNDIFLSSAAVNKHLTRIYGKLGVETRYKAVIKANQIGLIDCLDEDVLDRFYKRR
jgi:ATP/maltotriose-dependent transcriptional regulator MalT